MRSLHGTRGQASGGAGIIRFQSCRYHVESRLGAIAERIIGVRHVRSGQGTKDLENNIVRCVVRRAYVAAASTRGSELGCVVLGDSNHTGLAVSETV